MVVVEQHPTLLVCYDVTEPEPMHHSRPVQLEMGVGLVLTPQRNAATLARLRLEPTPAAADTAPRHVLQDALGDSNPVVAALPLLTLLARRRAGCVVLPQLLAGCVAVTLDDYGP